ncbi:MAG TPA: four-carbon acid sugar kinase family protein [Anaerolinea sp.]|nr:four-carbon acid sugar kinase family protein [Anaerolinea sp.]
MSAPQPLDAAILAALPTPDPRQAEDLLAAQLRGFTGKVVVLDDDPTGVQTVHDISVYTHWDLATLTTAFAEEERLFFVLTNSRSFVREQTIQVHHEIAQNLVAASRAAGSDFILISRSDSTLRGHYPFETLALKEEIERLTPLRFDGEVICPFFKEGGRFTLDDVHYVQEGAQLTPAGLTEFAQDRTFGYRASHLGEWCQEKTGGAYPAAQMTYIPLTELRAADVPAVEARLLSASGFNKIIVNAADEADVKVFAAALLRAEAQGKRFLLRSAAALPKVLGGVTDRALLTRADLVDPGSPHGGLIVVGSHVNKTTRQLDDLRNSRYPIQWVEFDQHRVLVEGGWRAEVARVVALIDEHIRAGRGVGVYTRRERLDLPDAGPERQLLVSVEISNAVTALVAGLTARPAFIIAKGGITSSDIGVKALGVRRATVMGQVSPGVPVWQTGPESKFPGMPYIIFPGNVGQVSTLREIVELLLA